VAKRATINYKTTQPEQEKAREKIEGDVEAFLAAGGEIKKYGIRINGVEPKQTREGNRERIRTQGWKRLNTMQTEGKP
jgi:hypothetical protein